MAIRKWFQRILIVTWIAAIPALLQAQSTWTGPTGGNWNDVNHWDIFTVPNSTTATANIDGPTSVDVDINVRLANLNLNTDVTTLSSSNGSSIQANAINVGVGASGSSIDNLFLMNSSATNLTTISIAEDDGVFNFGAINTSGSTASQTVRNISSALNTVVNFNGAIELRSTGAASPLVFQAAIFGNNTGTFVYNGEKTNGAGGTAGVSYSSGIHIHNVANSYTGTTVLGLNSPNILGQHVIATNSAFGTGTLQFGGASGAQNSVRSSDTTTRTLANRVLLQRNAVFDGTGSIELTNGVYQTNTSILTNNISGAGKALTISGSQLYTRGAADGSPRIFTFNGSGTTVLNSAVHERPIDVAGFLPETTVLQRGSAAGPYGGLSYTGTGRLILGNSFSANYGGNTIIASGTVQVGEGAAPVSIGAYSGTSPLGSFDALTPSSIVGTGAGTLDFRHNGSQVVNNVISGTLNIANTGSGTTTFNNPMFGGGTITSSGGGTIVINGGVQNSVTDTGVNPTGGGLLGVGAQTTANLIRLSGNEFIATNTFASNLYRGQEITITEGVNSVTGTVLDIYNPTSGVHTAQALNYGSHKIIRVAAAIPAVISNTALDSVVTAAGTGTGARNVIAQGGTIKGTGVIGGNLISTNNVNSIIAPGNSIGTLTVQGDSILAGVLQIEFDGAAMQPIDLLSIGNNLTLQGSSALQFSQLGSSLTGASYIFATYGGTLTGTFGTVNSLPTGYNIDYAFGGNNIALVLQAVPEPSAALLFCLTLGITGTTMRRRRS